MSNQVSALWSEVFQLPERARMMGGWEAAVGILLEELAGMFAEAADGAHVLPGDRNRIARLEPVADAERCAMPAPRVFTYPARCRVASGEPLKLRLVARASLA